MGAMGVRTRCLGTALAAAALICALPSPAGASHTMSSVLMDDVQFIYSSPKHMVQELEQAKALGVDEIKVSVVWSLVAPAANSHQRPNFDALDPGAYPAGAWTRWDRIVTYAAALGLKVYFQVVPPAPAWAVARKPPPADYGYGWSHQPSAKEFGEFVFAVGARYSGYYVPPSTQRTTTIAGLPISLPGILPTASDPNPPIPAVHTWGVWNEPNEAGWLSPQWKIVDHRQIDTSPSMYRRMVDYGYAGLVNAGHAADTILIGEIASRGWVYPLSFVHELYCVDGANHPLRGATAARLACPSSGDRASFVRTHPGLFATHAFAFHPYSFDQPPNQPMPNPNWITLANLGRLERTLDQIYAAYGVRSRHKVAMYLTEWGYKSNPPNPYVHTSLGQQATWLNQGEYLAYRDPRVLDLAQFELVDNAPRAGAQVGSRSYWSTFQSGLEFFGGAPKPSYAAFRLPIWLPRARHGSRVAVWGQLRAANHSQLQYGVLEYRRLRARGWSINRVIQTGSPEGFFVAHVSLPAAGAVRLAWEAPTGQIEYSRTVTIS